MFSVKDISEDNVAFIAAFASHYDMTEVKAYRYLNRYGAIKVAHEFCDVTPTQLVDDMVESMLSFCKGKGDAL